MAPIDLSLNFTKGALAVAKLKNTATRLASRGEPWDKLRPRPFKPFFGQEHAVEGRMSEGTFGDSGFRVRPLPDLDNPRKQEFRGSDLEFDVDVIPFGKRDGFSNWKKDSTSVDGVIDERRICHCYAL